ncbi:cobaltochelatase CobT-related protein [Sphingomonas sp. 3-13AW]|uniref:cobaltochelatase CobT-related protein n=1 Tax=Sphingomonas sp. 3-13AW TaxID=3050450 RepID=UPI003BB6A075
MGMLSVVQQERRQVVTDTFGRPFRDVPIPERRRCITGYHLRHVIEGVVRGITGKTIKHAYGGSGAATGEDFMLLPRIPQNWLFTVREQHIILGYTVHEICHQLYTEFALLDKIFPNRNEPEFKPTRRQKHLKAFWNAIEDYRIEKVCKPKHPGFFGYINVTRDHSAKKFMERVANGEYRPAQLSNPFYIGAVAVTWFAAALNGYRTPAPALALEAINPALRAWVESWGPELAKVAVNDDSLALAEQMVEDLYRQMAQSEANDAADEEPNNPGAETDLESHTNSDPEPPEADEEVTDPAEQPPGDDADGESTGEAGDTGEDGAAGADDDAEGNDTELPAIDDQSAHPSDEQPGDKMDAESTTEEAETGEGGATDDAADTGLPPPEDGTGDSDALDASNAEGDENQSPEDSGDAGEDEGDAGDPAGGEAAPGAPAADGQESAADPSDCAVADPAGDDGAKEPEATDNPGSDAGNKPANDVSDASDATPSAEVEEPEVEPTTSGTAPTEAGATQGNADNATSSSSDNQGGESPAGDSADAGRGNASGSADASIDPEDLSEQELDFDDSINEEEQSCATRPVVDVENADDEAEPEAADLDIDEIMQQFEEVDAAEPQDSTIVTPEEIAQDDDHPEETDTERRIRRDEVAKAGAARYAHIRASLGGPAQRSAGVVRRLLQSRATTRILRGREDGDLDFERVVGMAVGDSSIYRQMAKRIQINTALVVLLDNSGSMKGHPLEVCQQSAIVLDQSVAGTKTAIELTGFTSDWMSGKVQLYQYKTFDHKGSMAASSLGNMTEVMTGGTPVAIPIYDALRRLSARPEDRKIVIVVSDGGASDPVEALEAREVAESMGISVVGLSIGGERELVEMREWCRLAHGVSNIDQLPHALTSIVQEILH